MKIFTPSGISAIFKKFAEKEQHLKAIKRAIACGDMEALAPLLSSLSEVSHQDKDNLIRAAMEQDNVSLFRVVLSSVASNDPNYKFYNSFITFETISSTTYSLLHSAITQGKINIALDLAQDPRTDVSLSGRDGFHAFPSPLDSARKAQMNAVTSILARRTADILKSQANLLMHESLLRQPD